MKKKLIIVLSLVALIVLSFSTYVYIKRLPKEISIKRLVRNGDYYHKKDVIIQGRVYDVENKVSRAGNEYFKFNIYDSDEELQVFSFGVTKIKEEDIVRVCGKYYLIRRVGYATYENEIDASKGYVKRL